MKRPIANRQLAIGNDLAVAEGFEPSHGRINSAVPYQLGYATTELAAATRLELVHFERHDDCARDTDGAERLVSLIK